MDGINNSKFFEYLGEIWRDITAIEFLMRCAIAKKDGEIEKFPKPPYIIGRFYNNPPKSFFIAGFKKVVEEFNKRFENIFIPKEIIYLRNAMAHGIIAKVNDNKVEQLIKFKKKDNNNIEIEFSLPLEIKRLAQLNQSFKELRGYIMKECDDNK